MLDACSIIGLGRSAVAARGGSGELSWRSGAGPGSSLGGRVRDRRSFDRPGACYLTGDRNRYLLPGRSVPHGSMCRRHRPAIELSCGSIPPRNFARSTTILSPSTWERSSVLDQPEWFGRWRAL